MDDIGQYMLHTSESSYPLAPELSLENYPQRNNQKLINSFKDVNADFFTKGKKKKSDTIYSNRKKLK